MTPSPIAEAAQRYLRRGLMPIELDPSSKRCLRRGWEKERNTPESVSQWRPDANIGVLNGVPSHDLVDVDLDSAEAVALGPFFLPATPLVFGRAGKRKSHFYFFCSPPPATQQFLLPKTLRNGEETAMLLELRSTGTQTVWPPSTHPTGERYEFDGPFKKPAIVEVATLTNAVLRLAVASLLARVWPRSKSNRHEIAVAAAGFLVRRLSLEVVHAIIGHAAHYAGDEEARDRLRNVTSTARRLAQEQPTRGGPKLAKLIGDDVVATLEDWLSFTTIGTSGTIGTGTEGWPDFDESLLTPLVLPPPVLPLEVLSAPWRTWVRDAAAAKSCPIDYVVAGLLSATSTLLGNACWGSPWPGWVEPPLLWCVAVGLPSSGKSPGLDAARTLLESLERLANADFTVAKQRWEFAVETAALHKKVWEAEWIKAQKKGDSLPNAPEDATPPDPPRYVRYVTNDPTIEKIARLIADNPKGMLLFRDELAGWLGNLDRYGGSGSDRAFYLEAYGGRRYAVDRVKHSEPIVVPALTITLCGGVQPDRLSSLFLTGDDDGLVARFLWFWPAAVPPERPPSVALDMAQTWLTHLAALTIPAGEIRGFLQFAPGAATVLHAYRLETAALEAKAAGLFLSWLGKLPGMAVRLAVVLEYLAWCVTEPKPEVAPTTVSEYAATAAIAFLDAYAVPMARRCFGEAAWPQADRDAATLARWITEQVPIPEVLELRTVRRQHAPIGRDAARYDAAAHELGAAGWLRPVPRTGAFDRSKRWFVRPGLRGKP